MLQQFSMVISHCSDALGGLFVSCVKFLFTIILFLILGLLRKEQAYAAKTIDKTTKISTIQHKAKNAVS